MSTDLPDNVLFGRVGSHLANNVLFGRAKRSVPGTRCIVSIGHGTMYPVRVVLEASSWDVWY